MKIWQVLLFAWSRYDVPGVDPNFICNQLNINPEYAPKKKRSHTSSYIHAKAVKEEVNRQGQ